MLLVLGILTYSEDTYLSLSNLQFEQAASRNSRVYLLSAGRTGRSRGRGGATAVRSIAKGTDRLTLSRPAGASGSTYQVHGKLLWCASKQRARRRPRLLLRGDSLLCRTVGHQRALHKNTENAKKKRYSREHPSSHIIISFQVKSSMGKIAQ